MALAKWLDKITPAYGTYNFLCKCQKNCVHALLGHHFAQIPEEPLDEAVSVVSGIKCPLPVGFCTVGE
jgi:hypothetical protein